jgi:hypothetical protein
MGVVEGAGGIAIERTTTKGVVADARGVAEEGITAKGAVAACGRVVEERVYTDGGVVGALFSLRRCSGSDVEEALLLSVSICP